MCNSANRVDVEAMRKVDVRGADDPTWARRVLRLVGLLYAEEAAKDELLRIYGESVGWL